MFETLNDEIQRRQGGPETRTARWLRYLIVFLVTVVAFGTLYLGIRILE